jgi:murein tripeptide amidase MpaA
METNDYDLFKRGFHVYLFPMVNVDGVQQGNYRTNLSGNDLNRVWKVPRKDFHAEVYYIKRYLHNLSKTTSIKLIIDLHGHSSAFNSFFYGNPVKK